MEQQHDLQFASDLRTTITRLVKKLRKQSPTGQQLSLTERSTIALLNQHKVLLPSELAAMEMITNQSMSTVLNHLSALGYIVRIPSETDKRKVNISLSALGEYTLNQLRHERDEWLLGAIEHACTSQEREMLKQVLGPLTKIIDYK